MLRIKILSVILGVIFLLSGCSYDIGTNYKSSNEAAVNPFDTSEIDNESTIEGRYSIGLSEVNKKFVYTGDPIEVEVVINNGEKKLDIGFFVFINGIPHNYSIKESSSMIKKSDNLEYIQVTENSYNTATLAITPIIGSKGETLNIQVGSMMNPMHIPPEGYFSFGNQHKAMILPSNEVYFECDSNNTYKYEAIYTETINITSEIKEQYKIPNNIPLENYAFKFFNRKNNVDENNYIEIFENGKIELDFIAYGNLNQDFIVSIFVDHNIVCYFPITITADYLTKSYIEIENTHMENSKFIYVTVSPIKTNDLLFTEKSETKKIINSIKHIESKTNNTQSLLYYIDFYKNLGLIAQKDNQLILLDKHDYDTKAYYNLPEDVLMYEYTELPQGIMISYIRYDGRFGYTILDNNFNEILAPIDIGETISSFSQVSVSPEGTALIMCGDNNIYRYDIGASKGCVIYDVIENGIENIDAITGVKYLENEQIMFTGLRDTAKGGYLNSIVVLDSNKNIKDIYFTDIRLQGFIDKKNIAIWPQKHQYSDGNIIVFDGTKFKEIKTEYISESEIIKLSSNGEHIMTYRVNDNTGIYTLYNINTEEKIYSFEIKDVANINMIDVLINDNDKSILIYKLLGMDEHMEALAF